MPESTLQSARPSSRPLPPRQKWWGLLSRKERWHLSWRGWLFVTLLLFGSACLAVVSVYPFLACDRPVQSDVLAVEGWIHHYAMRSAADEIRARGSGVVFATGGPVSGSGGYTNDYNTYASVGGEELIASDIAREIVHIAPARDGRRDRTYGSALALRSYMAEKGLSISTLNVVTENTHARRSLLLFQKALGPEIKVGVIPIANPDYDPKRWWRYSEGVRDVMSESIAYLYAKFFFSPE